MEDMSVLQWDGSMSGFSQSLLLGLAPLDIFNSVVCNHVMKGW